MIKSEQQRQQAKTREQRFLSIMNTEYDFAPKFAAALLEEAQNCLLGETKGLKPGQIRVLLLPRQAPHGQALATIAMQEVTWTLSTGREDQEVEQEHGRLALRQTRIQRLLSEAVEQGAVASQEDLAQALQVSVRTIKRDCAAMQAQGIPLPTRGNLKGIGRGQTHKAQIVGRWLHGETYDQIAYHTRHSLTCVKRYVQTFARVVQLQQKAFAASEISLALQIGIPLVEQYLTLYEQNDAPFPRKRLAEQLQRLAGGQNVPKKGVS